MNNEEMITSMEGVKTNSKGGLIALAVGAVVAAAGVGTALFLKKRKANEEIDEAVVVTESEKDKK